MASYQILFLDRTGYVYALDHLRGASDKKAIAAARRHVTPGYGAGFEIWQNDRLVYREVVRQPVSREPIKLQDLAEPPPGFLTPDCKTTPRSAKLQLA